MHVDLLLRMDPALVAGFASVVEIQMGKKKIEIPEELKPLAVRDTSDLNRSRNCSKI